MRLEQLVLFGPEDDFRVPFGPQLTVLAGMRPQDRAEMIDTIVHALAGRLPNASVVYVDHAGRRIFADRTGATFAADGSPAPALTSLLGTEPSAVAALVTVDAAVLGLGERPSTEAIADELAATRATVEHLEHEREEAQARLVSVDEWRAELASLDDRIARATEDADRWAWVELRNELDGVRAELAAFDDGGPDSTDTRLLDAVEALRDLGEAWAEADAAATELSTQLGPVREVSDEDLERVAATPAALPEDFDEHLDAWQRATDERRRRDADHTATVAPVPAPADELVGRLGTVDQEELWAIHSRLDLAQHAYEDELLTLSDEVDPEVEAAIEGAHLEVLRCQRNVQRRFLPGALGMGALAVGALLAGQEISLFLGVGMLVAAVAMGWWLLLVPRRIAADAIREEEMALAGANAGSWLGLHLRRIDDVMQPANRQGLDAAGDLLATARLDWEELTGGADPDEALDRRDLIEAHAAAIDPERRAEREQHARTDLAIAREDEALTRSVLTEGLDAYGLIGNAIADIEPSQLRLVLDRRIAAGRVARDSKELRLQRKKAAIAAADLHHLLAELGFEDGELTTCLDRAIDAVTAARLRAKVAEQCRTRPEVEAEITAIAALVEAGRRLSWDLTPDPTTAPADPHLLLARRSEVSEMVAATTGPDLADADRRLQAMAQRAAALEDQLAQIAKGPASLHQRITDRVARTTWIGEQEESIPVLIDDAFGELTADERRGVLELLARLAARTQVVILSQDPVIIRWARQHASDGSITVLEADFVPA